MGGRLSKDDMLLANDLSRHLGGRMMTALRDTLVLCPDRRVRGNVALKVLAHMVGAVCAEIDAAEGRAPPKNGDVNPEAIALIIGVFEGMAEGLPPRAALQPKGDGGER